MLGSPRSPVVVDKSSKNCRWKAQTEQRGGNKDGDAHLSSPASFGCLIREQGLGSQCAVTLLWVPAAPAMAAMSCLSWRSQGSGFGDAEFTMTDRKRVHAAPPALPHTG